MCFKKTNLSVEEKDAFSTPLATDIWEFKEGREDVNAVFLGTASNGAHTLLNAIESNLEAYS